MKIIEVTLMSITAGLTFSFAWYFFMNAFRQRREAVRVRQEFQDMFTQAEQEYINLEHIKSTIDVLLKKRLSSILDDVAGLHEELKNKDCLHINPSSSGNQLRRFNYAAAEAGAQIINVEVEPLNEAAAKEVLIEYNSLKNPPILMLLQYMQHSSCYALKGIKGAVTIQLAAKIFIDTVEIEHIENSSTKNMNNAPKEFEVYSIVPNQAHLLGNFVYKTESKERSQVFNVKTYPFEVGLVRFVFLSNNGHPNETCIYKIGVYGRPN